MPVIPEFQPSSAPGSILQNSQSLMMRANADRRATESMEMERQKFEIMRPVLESQARVQLVSEANDLTAAYTVNNAIVEDLQRFPQYVKDWTFSAKIEDPKERLAERRRILGAITPFAAIKSTAPMVKAFQEQYAQDAQADKTADVLAGRVEVVGAQNDARAAKTAADNETKMAVKQKDLEIQQARLEAAQQKFEQQQAHAAELAKMKDETARRGQDLGKEKATMAAARPKEAAALKYNEVKLAEGERATTELRDYQQALDLLNSPDVRTGTAAQLETTLRRAAGLTGADVSKVKDIEQLQSIIGSSFLDRARQMKGSLSDKDVAILERLSPGIGKSNEGNIAILNFMVQARSRDLEIAKAVQEGRRAGLSEREIQMDVNDIIQQTPIAAFAPAQAASGLTPDEQTRLQELRSKLGK